MLSPAAKALRNWRTSASGATIIALAVLEYVATHGLTIPTTAQGAINTLIAVAIGVALILAKDGATGSDPSPEAEREVQP
jgi:hypothetical protein